LAVGYDGLSDEERRIRVKSDFATFLSRRADLLVRAAQLACTGMPLEPRTIFDDAEAATTA
jgi:hypothetical protein